MAVDPRTPVIVGVAQVVTAPDDVVDPRDRPSPQLLMERALAGALRDASARWRGGLDELVAIRPLSWIAPDPAAAVAEALQLPVRRTRLTPTGGEAPLALIHDGARRILAGELDALGIVGAEAVWTARRVHQRGEDVPWAREATSRPVAEPTGDDTVPFTGAETSADLVFPTEFYPLFENARRARDGRTLEDQRTRLGALWENLARVAATNPHAWITRAPGASEIATPSPTNRLIGFPYTKMLVANLTVDMGAAVVLVSFERAVAMGVARDQMVFPVAGAAAHDHWFVSERPALEDSPAMRAIWRALRHRGVAVDDLAHLDLYSCFPTVVQTAADVLGIDAFDAARVPTVTGGLTFAGGPGNNYVTHSLAAMTSRLQRDPDERGLVTGIGWFATKHAWGVFAGEPPRSPFTLDDVQAEVDDAPRCEVRGGDGTITFESYVVSHRHDGARKKLVVAGRFADGARTWAHSDDDDLMARFETEEMIGQAARVTDGRLSI